jgi:methyltransferase
MVTVKVYLAFLALLAVERLVELLLSRRNEAWARSRGGREFGGKHFGFMKVLHALFLFSCAGEVLLLARPFHVALGLSMFLVVIFAQSVRYWSVFTLGPYWNVRVIVVPGATPVTNGPYRYLRHPNYLAVILEGFAIPLIHTAWMTAMTFTLLNGVLLAVRIRCEEQALGAHSAYDDQFGNLPRLLPTRGGVARR